MEYQRLGRWKDNNPWGNSRDNCLNYKFHLPTCIIGFFLCSCLMYWYYLRWMKMDVNSLLIHAFVLWHCELVWCMWIGYGCSGCKDFLVSFTCEVFPVIVKLACISGRESLLNENLIYVYIDLLPCLVDRFFIDYIRNWCS